MNFLIGKIAKNEKKQKAKSKKHISKIKKRQNLNE